MNIRLNSSTFVSLIIAFLLYAGANDIAVVINSVIPIPNFQTIQSPTKEVDKELYMSIPVDINIMIFDKFSCDRCGDFMNETLPTLKNKYNNKEWVHIKYTPVINLDNILEKETLMAMRCSGNQGQFWQALRLIHNQDQLFPRRALDPLIKTLGIDMDIYGECMTQEDSVFLLDEGVNLQKEYNITEFPTILINDYRLIGNHPIENIDKIINEIINE